MQVRAIPMEELCELVMLQLEKSGRAPLTVTGCSMQPMLRHRRDTVELVPVSGRQKPGDIILYRRGNGQFVLHRIIALTPEGYLCCGDNQAEKEPVAQSQLLAEVDGFTRKGKRYAMDHPGYRLYAWAWVKLFFLRGCYIAIRRPVGRLCNRIRKFGSNKGGKTNG